MANEPVGAGDKVDVAGKKGVVVRGVAIRGGVEYTVRVADDDSPANQPLKLPQGYDPVAAYGTEEQAEVHEENARRDREEREELDEALRSEREVYTERERKLTDDYRNASDDDNPDVGPVSHLIGAEATRQVDAEREEKRRGSTVDSRAAADKQDRPETKLRDKQTTTGPDEHGSNLADQSTRGETAVGGPRAGQTADAKPSKAAEDKRNR